MAAKKKRQDPFREIQNCLQKRNYKGALGWFQTLLEREKKNTQIRLRYADTLVLAGSKNEAIKQYRIVADELAESGFMIRAIAINKKIVKLDPRQTDVHQKLAEMNEARSKGRSAAMAQLSDALVSDPAVETPQSPPGPSPAPPTPIAAEPPQPEPQIEAEAPAEPTMSLEDSLAMEFGDSPGQGASESLGETPVEEGPAIADPPELTQPVDSPEPGSAEPPLMEDAAEDDELILLDEDEVSGPLPVQEVEEEKDVEITLDASPPGLEDASQNFEMVPEPVAEIPADDSGPDIEFESADEGPSFSVEQAIESQEVLESEEAAVDHVLASADDVDAAEEGPDVEFDIEMEPDAAADGADPLVGVLGEDIDALIDSIIDDVGSSASAPHSPPPQSNESPGGIPLFSQLTMQEFIDVAVVLERRSVKTGTVIVREGDPGDSMFIVSTGEADATVEDNGKTVKVHNFKDGDFFGEMAVLSGEPRNATVTAVKNTELLELSRDNLHKIFSKHPEVEAKIRLANDERAMNPPK
jgi:disulfide oxidoreductase YuzD